MTAGRSSAVIRHSLFRWVRVPVGEVIDGDGDGGRVVAVIVVRLPLVIESSRAALVEG